MMYENEGNAVRIGIEPPLRHAFIGNFVGNGWTTEAPLADNVEIARFLSGLALHDLDGRPITEPSEEGDEIIARMMAAEAMAAANRNGPSSLHWYTDAIDRAFSVAATMFPEVEDDERARAVPSAGFSCADDARTVLIAAMAITSQNMDVHANMKAAIEQYRAFAESGAFRPRTYGAKGHAIAANLDRFNVVLGMLRGDIGRFKRLLSARFTMGEFKAAGAKFGIRIGGKELADETVYGSMMFGPKIGNGFMQNLMGNYSPVTIDLWFMRMWGRYTGRLVGDSISDESLPRLVKGLRRSMRGKRMAEAMGVAGIPDPSAFREMDPDELLDACRDVHRLWERVRKAHIRKGATNEKISAIKLELGWPGAAESIIKSLGMPIDSPKNASHRRWIRSVVTRALAILDEAGQKMTAADLQALLWYPEKELYDRLAGRPVGLLNVSYDEAMASVARREGVPEEAVEAALRSPRGEGAPMAEMKLAAGF